MRKKIFLITTLTLTLAVSCSEDMLDNKEDYSVENSVNYKQTVQDFKSWFYTNYNELSDNQLVVDTEEENNIIRSQNKIIFPANLDWDRYSLYDYDSFYILHVPMFNSEIKTSLSSDMNMRGYADLSVVLEKNTKEYKLCIVEIHPDKAYMKTRGLEATKEMFMEYRRVKSTDPDFSGYVYYKEIDGTSISLYRLTNGKIVN